MAANDDLQRVFNILDLYRVKGFNLPADLTHGQARALTLYIDKVESALTLARSTINERLCPASMCSKCKSPCESRRLINLIDDITESW